MLGDYLCVVSTYCPMAIWDFFIGNKLAGAWCWLTDCHLVLIFTHEPETKHQPMEYYHKGSHEKKRRRKKKQFWREKPRLQFFGTQVVLFTWTALNLRPPATDSAALQYSKLWKKWLRPVWQHKKNILLQHDSLRPHTAMQAIEQSDLAISPHLLYSPHLVPCNVHIFFLSRNEGRTVRTWIKKQNVAFCDDRCEKLFCCWWKCVGNGGDHVERWIMVIKWFISRFICLFHSLKHLCCNKSNQDGGITCNSLYVIFLYFDSYFNSNRLQEY